jgi:thymidylate synthase
MRSNDVIWGLCYDVYLVTMLQELLALELGAEFGGYYHTASSMHLYKNFYPMAEKILAEPLPEEPVGMQPMSHPEEVPSFLQAEAQFRAGLPEATLTLERLHPYWRNLAAPLVARRSSVEAAAQVAA